MNRQTERAAGTANVPKGILNRDYNETAACSVNVDLLVRGSPYQFAS
jgi:hypothetical protein